MTPREVKSTTDIAKESITYGIVDLERSGVREISEVARAVHGLISRGKIAIALETFNEGAMIRFEFREQQSLKPLTEGSLDLKVVERERREDNDERNTQLFQPVLVVDYGRLLTEDKKSIKNDLVLVAALVRDFYQGGKQVGLPDALDFHKHQHNGYRESLHTVATRALKVQDALWELSPHLKSTQGEQEKPFTERIADLIGESAYWADCDFNDWRWAINQKLEMPGVHQTIKNRLELASESPQLFIALRQIVARKVYEEGARITHEILAPDTAYFMLGDEDRRHLSAALLVDELLKFFPPQEN